MTTILAATERDLMVARGSDGSWVLDARLEGTSPRCLAVDTGSAGHVWCGTSGSGVWRSPDAGVSWERSSDAFVGAGVSAIAVAPGGAHIYAGTDPTALHRSDDGGNSWRELAALRALPSAPTWSFPPQPDTSHVRWITIDPADEAILYVCIEAGALVRSWDGGETWTDRVPEGPYDTHTLAAHPMRPGRLYSAAGDGLGRPGHGYQESPDRGDHWAYPDEGLAHHYLYGLAVDPGDPDTVVVSAAMSPWTAHNPRAADSTVYVRTAGGPWREVHSGLPNPVGTTRALLAANAAEPGVFYMASNRGLFRSADGGTTWERLPVDWLGDPNAIAVVS